MTINTEKKDGTLIAAIEGDLDRTTSPELESRITPMLDSVTELVFDLAGLKYISSAGLRVFVKMQKLIGGGKMTLRHVAPAVMEIFRLSGFTNFLNIEE